MRVLLDEQLPLDLAAILAGHNVVTVVGAAGLASRTVIFFGVCQPNIAELPFGVLLVLAPSNRIVHLQPLIPAILEALPGLKPGQLHHIGR